MLFIKQILNINSWFAWIESMLHKIALCGFHLGRDQKQKLENRDYLETLISLWAEIYYILTCTKHCTNLLYDLICLKHCIIEANINKNTL